MSSGTVTDEVRLPPTSRIAMRKDDSPEREGMIVALFKVSRREAKLVRFLSSTKAPAAGLERLSVSSLVRKWIDEKFFKVEAGGCARCLQGNGSEMNWEMTSSVYVS
jgi:hypothetical protein